jgi:hypothetical protein
MTNVPDGQVPRDGAFWATYDAVNREQEQAWAEIRCQEFGHELVTSIDWSGCQRCRKPLDEALADSGFVLEGNRWVKRFP